MNHAKLLIHEGLQPYQQRGYITSELDDAHAEAACACDMLLGLNGYCLDAVDQIPAGGMTVVSRLPAQVYAMRGMTLAEQREVDEQTEQLIAEILAEEQACPLCGFDGGTKCGAADCEY